MMIEKELKMSVVFKSKAELRAETEKQVALFLKKGGSVEIVKSRKAPKQTMRCKVSRGLVTGTSGFATGMPRKSTFALA
jgi:hypothetical protein